MNILIVDDDYASVIFLIEELKNLGHNVQTIGSINEAYIYVSENFENIDGIVLDMRMPGGEANLGGVTLYRRILEFQAAQFHQGNRKFIPIAVVSQLGRAEFESDLLEINSPLPQDERFFIWRKNEFADANLTMQIVTWFARFLDKNLIQKIVSFFIH